MKLSLAATAVAGSVAGLARNEKTGKSVGSIASKGLRTGSLTKTETKKVSASALTQRPDKGGSKGGKKKR